MLSEWGPNPEVLIDGGDENRLFDIHLGGTLDLSNVSLVFGSPEGDGGAIRNEGTLVLHDAVIRDAFDVSGTGINGGGIYNTGDATLANVLIHRNSVTLDGGGIYNAAGATLTATNVTFSRNQAGGRGGGLYDGGIANLFGITCSDNEATVAGADFFNVPPGVINATGTFTANESAVVLISAGGTLSTDTEVDGATPSDPIETSVMSPNPGTISIFKGSGMNGDFTIGGLIVRISAPPATPTAPLTLVFLIDGADPNTVVVLRNGAPIPGCTGLPLTADPDPCVSNRQMAGGDAEVTVLTSAASDWTFQSAPTVEPPALSIGDASVAEGDAGTTDLVFSVTRTGDTTGASSVDFATANGTAVAPGDYQPATGTLNFAAGDLAQTIVVQVSGDTAVEPDETLVVNLSNPVGAAIADGQGEGSIENDDLAPPEPATDIRIKGEGSIEGIGKNAFKVKAGFKKDGRPAGHVNFQEKGGKLHFRSTSISAVTCTGGRAAVIDSRSPGGAAPSIPPGATSGRERSRLCAAEPPSDFSMPATPVARAILRRPLGGFG